MHDLLIILIFYFIYFFFFLFFVFDFFHIFLINIQEFTNVMCLINQLKIIIIFIYRNVVCSCNDLIFLRQVFIFSYNLLYFH